MIDPEVPDTCPACDKPVSAVEKRQLPLAGSTFPDSACITDSDTLPATVSVTDYSDSVRLDVAVVTHRSTDGR